MLTKLTGLISKASVFLLYGRMDRLRFKCYFYCGQCYFYLKMNEGDNPASSASRLKLHNLAIQHLAAQLGACKDLVLNWFKGTNVQAVVIFGCSSHLITFYDCNTLLWYGKNEHKWLWSVVRLLCVRYNTHPSLICAFIDFFTPIHWNPQVNNTGQQANIKTQT